MASKHIAVLSGGFSAEENISLQSGEVVYKSLLESGFTPHLIRIGRDGWFCGEQTVDKTDFSISYEGQRITFDAAFVAIHGSPGENGLIQGYLELLGIPHTTCGTTAAAITFDKAACKELATARGTRAQMATSVLVTRQNRREAAATARAFKLPVFVKPNQNGSSYGISRIKDWDKLDEALNEGFKYDSELLVEEGVDGIEVTCGLYMKNGKLEALPLCEIVSGHDFFNYTAKYTSGEAEEIIPARISPEATKKCRQISRELYRKLCLKGLVRMDFIYSGEEFYFLEVNTVPGLSENSIVPRMVKATGETLTSFFEALLQEEMVA